MITDKELLELLEADTADGLNDVQLTALLLLGISYAYKVFDLVIKLKLNEKEETNEN